MHSKPAIVTRATLLREKVPSFADYPFSLPIISGLHDIELHPRVTFFVGENGSGKSTLIEAIAVAMGMNAEGGSKNFNFATHATHSPLGDYLRIARSRRAQTTYFLRAESFYNVISEIDREGLNPIINERGDRPYGPTSLHEQSHGESFLSLLTYRFGGNGLYILDEPEAALSPMRQMTLLARMHQLTQAGSQFIIATHSPIIMAYPEATIYSLSGGAIRPIAYEDTEHYKVTRGFLENPARSFRVLFEQE